MSKYKLCEVKSAAEAKTFLNMVEPIYKDFENWIYPLDMDIAKVFDPSKNKMYAEGDAVRYLVFDSKKRCVGRIAAFYNETTAVGKDSTGSLRVGGCGFFESINDSEVSTMLFDKAVEWLKQHGCEAMDGPINFGDREVWWGLLTEGFGKPIYGMPFNPPYYKELFEGYGFQDYFNGLSYYKDVVNPIINPTMELKAERLKANPDYSFNHIKKSDMDSMAKDFCEIYKSAWSKFEGIAEIHEDQILKMIHNMKPIIDEKLIYFAYYKGEPIGFFIMIPDINQFVYDFKGKMNFWNTLKFLYRLKIKKDCKIAQGVIFGVKSEHQGKGIESGIINRFREEILSGSVKYETLELTWVGDFNPLMMRMVEKYVVAEKIKSHTTYRLLFDKNRPFERAPKVSISRNR